MRVLVIGRGTVGSALAKVLDLHHDVTTYDKKDVCFPAQRDFAVIHITIPFSKEYVEQIAELLKEFKATVVIVHSTIVLGIMERLKQNHPDISWYFSPVRGREADMEKDLQKLPVLIAPRLSDPLRTYLKTIARILYEFDNPDDLVMGKLLEVTWFGMNIAFAQQAKLICDSFGLDFKRAYTNYFHLSRVARDYNERPLNYMKRPIFVPGYVGGKCVIQDVQLMRDFLYGDPRLWNFIMDINDKFRGEKDAN